MDAILNSEFSSMWIHGDFEYVTLNPFMDLCCKNQLFVLILGLPKTYGLLAIVGSE